MSARDDYRDMVFDKPTIVQPLQASSVLDEIDRLRALAVDLWDEVMAWHLDDCPFPDSPMGTMDDQCICHPDLLITFMRQGALGRSWHET